MRTIPVTTFAPDGRVVDRGETQIPDEPVDRLAALEAQAESTNARMDAAVALADKANATAQEVAQAMRDARPGKP